MRIKASRQVMAVATALVLLMLSATARTVGQTNTSVTTATTTETSETTSQSGPNGTTTQAQSSFGGTTSTSPQTEGDAVNTIELDQSSQSQILAALANGTIAGEVEVNDSGVFSSVVDSRFSLIPVEGTDGRLDVQVSGENVTGPRSFLITLSKGLDPTTHTLVVTLDGYRVSQASSLGQVLHPISSVPSYVVVKSSSVYELLVSLPHFSTHQLAIIPLPFGPLQGFFSINQVSLSAAVVAITVIFAIAFASRKRLSVPLV